MNSNWTGTHCSYSITLSYVILERYFKILAAVIIQQHATSGVYPFTVASDTVQER